MRFRCLAVCLAIAASILATPSAQGVKRPLTHGDYDAWRSIFTPTLSRDGRYLVYSYMPQDGDGDLVVRDLKTGQERRAPVGALPPPPLPNPEETNRFRAAGAGAPVGNMTSAYSGIRWGSGLPRQFQYEGSQSRIGRPLYDAPHKYIENSPIFHVDRVTTPMLLLHNDADDAVPWYQGIEMFLALRRTGKEAYLFTYNGEFHGLRRRHNQKDYAVRMQQFFDHFLKGAPKPEWMEKGIPFIEREEEKERFRKTSE